jgi:hypothetical protein
LDGAAVYAFEAAGLTIERLREVSARHLDPLALVISATR